MANTIILLLILFFVVALFYGVQKGFNEVIAGLNAIHEQLRKSDGQK
jgi:hypothetical protein